jgi:hypothetical protein
MAVLLDGGSGRMVGYTYLTRIREGLSVHPPGIGEMRLWNFSNPDFGRVSKILGLPSGSPLVPWVTIEIVQHYENEALQVEATELCATAVRHLA